MIRYLTNCGRYKWGSAEKKFAEASRKEKPKSDMEKRRQTYEKAELEVVLFEFSDIVTASILDTDDKSEQTQAPSIGDWDAGGWR